MLIVVNLISWESRYREDLDGLCRISDLVIRQALYYQKIDTVDIYEMNSMYFVCLRTGFGSFVISVNLDHSWPNSDICPGVAFKFFSIPGSPAGPCFRVIIYVRALTSRKRRLLPI